MTEDDLVAALQAVLGRPAGGKVLVGIGDDAAVWQPSRSHRSVITTDALIEDVHFTRAGMSAADVGYRALASNLSDIAAMGARPVLATVALGVPAGLDSEWIVEMYRGMAELAGSSGTQIAGGDIVRAPSVAISITVVGEVRPSRLKLRGGGRPGDVLAVTGPLGASRAGLAILQAGAPISSGATISSGAATSGGATISAVAPSSAGAPSEEDIAAALTAHRRPVPRLAEGRFLAASRSVNAMMDLSDGLSTDVARLARMSGCGASLDEIPLSSCVTPIARAAGDDPRTYGIAGGEDFELLVAVAPRAFSFVAGNFARRFGRPLLRVGELKAGAGVGWALSGMRTPPAGFDHLSTLVPGEPVNR